MEYKLSSYDNWSDRKWLAEAGFIGKLFDLSFEESITPYIACGSFGVYLIIDSIVSLVILAKGPGSFLVRLLVAVLFFFMTLIWVRLGLESLMTLHLIEKNTRSLRSEQKH